MTYEETSKELIRIGEQMVKNIKDAIKKSGKYNTGNLYNSVTMRINRNGLSIIIGAKYAKFVLEGRRAGKNPPVSAMLSWLDSPHELKFLKIVKQKDKSISKLSVAFMLSNSIGKKNIPPMKQKSLYDATMSLKATKSFVELEKAFVKDLKKELNDVLK